VGVPGPASAPSNKGPVFFLPSRPLCTRKKSCVPDVGAPRDTLHQKNPRWASSSRSPPQVPAEILRLRLSVFSLTSFCALCNLKWMDDWSREKLMTRERRSGWQQQKTHTSNTWLTKFSLSKSNSLSVIARFFVSPLLVH